MNSFFMKIPFYRGVGAMEIVAMDMKLRGMYIARQLSFQGVSFRVDEVELSPEFKRVYDKAVEFWVDLLHKFEEAAALVDADKKVLWYFFTPAKLVVEIYVTIIFRSARRCGASSGPRTRGSSSTSASRPRCAT